MYDSGHAASRIYVGGQLLKRFVMSVDDGRSTGN